MDNDLKDQDAPLQSNQKEETQEGKADASDKLTPEHPRFKEVLDRAKVAEDKAEDLQTQIEDLKSQVNQRQEETGDEELNSDELLALDKIEKAFKKRGYATKNEIQEDLRVDRMARDFERLSQKYNGADGTPKFEPVEVKAYATKHNLGDNLEVAYREMHWQTLINLEAKNLGNAPEVPESEKPTGGEGKSPQELDVSELAKTATDPEWEEQRENILASIKAKAK